MLAPLHPHLLLGLWQSQLNSFGPLALLTAIDTDQKKPTPSMEVEQTRVSTVLKSKEMVGNSWTI